MDIQNNYISTNVQNSNFRNMTSSEFFDQAQNLYNKGEIDITELSLMQLTANGLAGTSIGNTPQDFISILNSTIEFSRQTGNFASLKYQNNILSKISR